jgi:hypothetical protein
VTQASGQQLQDALRKAADKQQAVADAAKQAAQESKPPQPAAPDAKAAK